eukprot:TRINITY_DN3539_c0_g1_i2.p1 TRINITY_DN3539_c0_g1~~TRINITY_DN3539_c0_g1_i2.p1  ORF type:complete len:882 (-),score=228.11 TRINITY_DN3539_c0_g1_i2:274-2871(-)
MEVDRLLQGGVKVLLVKEETPVANGTSPTMRFVQSIMTELNKLHAETIHASTWADAVTVLASNVDVATVLIDWENAHSGELQSDLIMRELPSNYHVVMPKRKKWHQKKPMLNLLESKGFNVAIPKTSRIDPVMYEHVAPDQLQAVLRQHKLQVVESATYLIRKIRKRNKKLPLFVLTDRLSINRIPLQVFCKIRGYIWKNEDTPSFIAHRIFNTATDYLTEIIPPFFKAILKYTNQSKYSWHTPGHMGGVAFLRFPVGKFFFDFLGENMLRSDLSVSVLELGSLLEHTDPIGAAERHAAEVFGAEHTFFVTNGTSTANKMVFQSEVVIRDRVLLDRNSHKSSMQAIQLCGAEPTYLIPVRNAYGIIGPVPFNQIVDQQVGDPFKLAILTNSTYDGICYNVKQLLKMINTKKINNFLFDEAWYAYANFHPLYNGFYAMSADEEEEEELPPNFHIYATQSTHKALAALSQASMVHIRNVARYESLSCSGTPRHRGQPPPTDSPNFSPLSGSEPGSLPEAQPQQLPQQPPLPPPSAELFGGTTADTDEFFVEHFNNSFMMNTSTSPQYVIIASLDVAASMMELMGRAVLSDTVKEAIAFRKRMEQILEFNEVPQPNGRVTPKQEEKPHWWFRIWQPEGILKANTKDPNFWVLPKSPAWHGFDGLEGGRYMLDPLKVTVITQNLGRDKNINIPAPIVAKFLQQRGIVVEKVGFYTLLVLFTVGVTRGKSGTLIAELYNFKKCYDSDEPLSSIFPDLYPSATCKFYFLQQFCADMSIDIMESERLANQVSSYLPKRVLSPHKAYCCFVNRSIEYVPVDKITGRVSATLIVPYPPGVHAQKCLILPALDSRRTQAYPRSCPESSLMSSTNS